VSHNITSQKTAFFRIRPSYEKYFTDAIFNSLAKAIFG
jgi:hypothetical protein